MTIDQDTKIIARLHPDLNGRGLNIYNPYFDAVGLNVDYHLFQTGDLSAALEAMRVLGMSGAVTAGSFETDPRTAELVDELSPLAARLGKVAMVANERGSLVGHHQAAFGLLDMVERLCGSIEDANLAIVGGGTVVRAFLILLELQGIRPKSVKIYVRSPEKATPLQSEFECVSHVRPLRSIESIGSTDLLINATPIGSPWNRGESFDFRDAIVSRFSAVADVTFVPLETPLTKTASRLGLKVAHGSEMFLGQAAYVLRHILGHDVDRDVFRQIMRSDFESNWS